ncbi:MAG: MinD/ParA family ATP-binding protein [Egibacteraceae bacterium]
MTAERWNGKGGKDEGRGLDWSGRPTTTSPSTRPGSVDWVRAPAGGDAPVKRPPELDPKSRARGEQAVPFDDERMLTRRANNLPACGWRRWVHQLTRGLVRPGPNRAELRARRLVATITQPIDGSRMIAVISTKGGVGKTSTTINLGHTFAAFRGDRVVALDGNPDAGSLAYRIRRETRATIVELLADLVEGRIHSCGDIRRLTSQASSRLEVIASPDDPRASKSLSIQDYQQVLGLLRRYFTLILADCGTGILDPVTQGIVSSAEQLLVVTSPSIDAARAVSFMLSWLTEHGHAPLVDNAIVVMNAVPPRMGPVNLPEIERHFVQRVRAVVRIPWDPHLEAGARTDLEDLAPATRDAYVHLAATVSEGFTPPRG